MLTKEQLDAMDPTAREAVLKLMAENQQNAKKTEKGLTFKVSEKGLVCAYGLGRFPVSLYLTQLVKFAEGFQGMLDFAIQHADKLNVKDGADRESLVSRLKAVKVAIEAIAE
jgi:hypothetical protein